MHDTDYRWFPAMGIPSPRKTLRCASLFPAAPEQLPPATATFIGWQFNTTVSVKFP
jgi:hypothetical protein